MSLQACADLVARGDPDRFRAAMATPPEARAVLFPLYAFNLEVSRAPWVTEEPMIAEMRLQFWRDVAEEIGQGARPGPMRWRAARGGGPGGGCGSARRAVAARRWDIYKDAFEDAGHFERYLDATGGNLDWAAARALGAPDGAERRCATQPGRRRCRGSWWRCRNWRRGGASRWSTGGRRRSRRWRRRGSRRLARARAGAGHGSARAGYALYAGWQAEAMLRRAAADPARWRRGG
jgi:phytoene synthase